MPQPHHVKLYSEISQDKIGKTLDSSIKNVPFQTELYH